MEENSRGNIQQSIQGGQSSQQSAGFVNGNNRDGNNIQSNGQGNGQGGNRGNIVSSDTTTTGTGPVVSLKGGLTQKEIDEQKRIEELKKKAVKLERKLTPKEKELERMHKEAVRPAAPIVASSQKNTKPKSIQGAQAEDKTISQNVKSNNQEQDRHTDQIKQVENLINPVEKSKIKNEYLSGNNQNMPVDETKTVNPVEKSIAKRDVVKSSETSNIDKKPIVRKEREEVKNKVQKPATTEKINQAEATPKRRMVISPTGQISYIENSEPTENIATINKNGKELNISNDTKTQLSKPFSAGPSRNIINLKDKKEELDNNINDKQSAEGNNTEQESKVPETSWEGNRVDLKDLSAEKRSDIQATPSMASVHFNMDDDLNGEVANWFEEYNKLPVNIKLGLGDAKIRQKIKEFANKFGLITNEAGTNEGNLGEISRMVRDVYVKLIKAEEIKARLRTILKLKESMIEEALKDIGSIVAEVKDIGNKKSEEYFEKLSIKEALTKYPNIANQEITTGMIKDKQTGEYIDPTVQNWINDYVNRMGSGSHTNLERGKYLNDSINPKNLEQEDKEKIEKLTKSYDENTKLIIDREEKVILWSLHDDESRLGINSDKTKRVINKFKIEEAQSVDIDSKKTKGIGTAQGVIKQNIENNPANNNLENTGDNSIINNANQGSTRSTIPGKTTLPGGQMEHRDDEKILNLSSEIENLR